MSEVYKFKLSTPAFVDIVSHDEKHSKTVDLFVAYQEVIDSHKEPTEQAKWNRLRKYIADNLGVAIETVSVSQAVEFNDGIIALSKSTTESAKKKFATTVSLQPSIPVSQETIPNGLSG
jgi:hypothetical protein